MVDLDTRTVALHPLTFVDEGDEVVVGRADIESYAVLSADGAAVLRRLGEGMTPAHVATWYEQTYDEALDIADFLVQVGELGFLRPDQPAGPPARPEPAATAADVRPLRFQRTASLVYSRAGALVAAVIAAAAGWSMVTRPQTRPSATHVFFTGYLVLIPLVMIAVELPLMYLHELSHVLAGRRIGIRSRVGIGRRLYFVVFQTTLTGVYSVPRRQRYLIFLAGMITDSMVLCTLVLISAATIDGPAQLVGRIAVAAAYFTGMRFAWQFLFFLETDMHHVLSSLLKITDLKGMTRSVLRARLRRQPLDPSFTPHERAVLRWFAPLTAAGIVLTVGGGLATIGPVVVTYLRQVAEGIATGATSTQFWDAVISLAMVIGQFSLVAVLSLGSRGKNRPAAHTHSAA
ncbi:MAG TPA: hypothetical protein VGX23_25860 [Actinocrinis sp.]|nr:hypothetical protein [Actinocrinis sp.]